MLKNILYFAYGSNLSETRLEFRIGRQGLVKKHSTYRLKGYKLIFNCYSFYTNAAFANIIKGTEDDYVDGVLYEINAYQLKELDFYEALYEKYFFDLPDGYLGCVYICTKSHLLIEDLPTLDYLNVIIDGALEQHLYDLYKQLLGYKLDNFKLKSSKHKQITF